MLLFALIVGLILGYMLRGWLESTWIGRLLRKRKDDADGRTGSGPTNLLDRAKRRFFDSLFGSKKNNDKPGGRK